ncbi:MAG: hypothetical protein PUP93_20045 [Rhizonema sp. NSF051]|nr:hypothetical protein [Rhizonema sp. NSF051]
MLKLFRNTQRFFERRFSKVSRQAVVNFNQEFEELVNKALENKEIEEILVQAVERVIFSLLRRYLIALIISAIVLLFVQAVILSMIITVLLKR